MTIKEFVENYREAFGERAPLPIAVAYSDTPAAEVKSVPRCMIGAISKVRSGEPLALCAENVLCGGGRTIHRLQAYAGESSCICF